MIFHWRKYGTDSIRAPRITARRSRLQRVRETAKDKLHIAAILSFCVNELQTSSP